MRSQALRPQELDALRAIFEAAWRDDFTSEDWEHMFPGVHFLLEQDGGIASHGAVVERELDTGDHELLTGWVENVATPPEFRGRGYGTTVVRAVSEHIASRYQLGGLDTGSRGFYERLGWQTWRGPTNVRTDDGLVPTPDEDGAVMVLVTPTTPNDLDLGAPISCEWRPGDAW